MSVMSSLYWLAFIVATSFADSEECRFGAGCVFACHCPDNTECSSETGECTGGGGCEEGWSGEGCQVGNVALHKPTSASSTASDRPASHAVDGDYDTLTHVNSDRGRWTVDLRHKFVVTNINITNRLGGDRNHYGARLQYNHIWLHNTSDFMIHTVCSYITQPTVDLSLVSVQCDEPTAARYVTLIKDDGEHEGVPEGYLVDMNNFFEVEVIGYQYQFSTVCDGRFGPGCLLPCNCQTECNTITGRCLGDCVAGWTGENCQQACARGQWGVNCAQPCSQACYPNDNCDRFTGTCDSCKQYYIGDSCQIDFTVWYRDPIDVTPFIDTAEIAISLINVGSLNTQIKVFVNNTFSMTIVGHGQETLSFTLKQLKPSSYYTVHIIPTITYRGELHEGPPSKDITFSTKAALQQQPNEVEIRRINGNKTSAIAGAAVGGTVGGVVIAVAAMVLILRMRRCRRDETAHQETTQNRGAAEDTHKKAEEPNYEKPVVYEEIGDEMKTYTKLNAREGVLESTTDNGAADATGSRSGATSTANNCHKVSADIAHNYANI